LVHKSSKVPCLARDRLGFGLLVHATYFLKISWPGVDMLCQNLENIFFPAKSAPKPNLRRDVKKNQKKMYTKKNLTFHRKLILRHFWRKKIVFFKIFARQVDFRSWKFQEICFFGRRVRIRGDLELLGVVLRTYGRLFKYVDFRCG